MGERTRKESFVVRRRPRLKGALVAALVVGLGVCAWSPSALADTLVLNDGTVLIGTIERVSGLFYHFRERGSSSTTMISKDDVADIRESDSGGSKAADEADAAQAEADRLRAHAEYERQRQQRKERERAERLAEPIHSITVHLEGSEAAELHRSESIDGARVVCRSPCGMAIDVRASDRFAIAGSGVPEAELSMPLDVSDARFMVDAGNTGARVGGIVAMAVGGAGALIGAIVLVDASRGGNRIPEPKLIGGGVGIGAGVAVTGVGVALFVALGRTQVELLPSAGDARLQLDLSAGVPALRF